MYKKNEARYTIKGIILMISIRRIGLLIALNFAMFRRDFFKILLFVAILAFSFFIKIEHIYAASNDTKLGSIESDLSSKTLKKKVHPVTILHFSHAQTIDVWGTISDVTRAKGNFLAINKLLNNKYGTPEGAISSIGFESGIVLNRKSTLTLGLHSEAVLFGLVQNPVVPELSAHGIGSGLLQAGYIIETPLKDFSIKVGATSGFGREIEIRAVITDLIDKIPKNSGYALIYGLDLDLYHHFNFNNKDQIVSHWFVQNTFYDRHSISLASEEKYKRAVFVQRWNAISTYSHKFAIGNNSMWSMGVDGVAGPQPLPVAFLPRTWDYIYNISTTPELGTLFGFGLNQTFNIGRHWEIGNRFGFYGGYIGGNLSARYRSVSLTLSSWELETTTAYHVLGQRYWHAGLGFEF